MLLFTLILQIDPQENNIKHAKTTLDRYQAIDHDHFYDIHGPIVSHLAGKNGCFKFFTSHFLNLITSFKMVRF